MPLPAQALPVRTHPRNSCLPQAAAAAASVEQVSGALTNLVYRCTSPTAAANSTVIIRVFGSGGKLFSQRDERNIFLLASELGVGPKCLVGDAMGGGGAGRLRSCQPLVAACQGPPLQASNGLCSASGCAQRPKPQQLRVLQVEFGNGRVEEFLPGATLSAATMKVPAVSAAIAAALAAFHVRMLAQLPAARHGGAAASDADSGSMAAADGLQDAQQQQQRRQRQQHGDGEAAPGLQPAIYGRILTWHAAAQQLCGDTLRELGLGDLPREVSREMRAHALRHNRADDLRCRSMPPSPATVACV
jgi:hypothetical protein